MENAACCSTNLEGILLDGSYRILEEDLRSECVAVVDDGLVIWSIPAVQLHTAAALQQSPGRDQTSDTRYIFTETVEHFANHTWLLSTGSEIKVTQSGSSDS